MSATGRNRNLSITTFADLRRTVCVVPGYDCVRTPCGKNGCGTSPGAEHGIHDDEWVYSLGNTTMALALVVSSGIYPETVPIINVANMRANRTRVNRTMAARAVALEIHTSFPRDRDDLKNPPTTSCEFLVETAPCHVTAMFTEADPFFLAHGSDRFEQPESFWRALLALHAEWAKSAEADRVDHEWARCTHCAGVGLVALVPHSEPKP